MSRSVALMLLVNSVMREILESLLIKNVRNEFLPSRIICKVTLSAFRLRIRSYRLSSISFFFSIACNIARRSRSSNFNHLRIFENGFYIFAGKFSSSPLTSAFSSGSNIK